MFILYTLFEYLWKELKMIGKNMYCKGLTDIVYWCKLYKVL